MTAEEEAAIAALQWLARRWPPMLKLLSMDGSLCVIHTADSARISDSNDPGRHGLVLADIDGIPNDGGAW
jgi:hypothetical protein